MAEILELNEAKTFINDHFGNRASEITPLSGGDWSQAYALSLDDKPVVARFSTHGEDYKKDQIMSRWSSSELPIPKVMELGEIGHGFFALSERAEGDSLDTLNVQQMGAVVPGLLRMMDAIRNIDISGTNGCGIWGSDGQGPQNTWREALLYKFGKDQPGSRTYGWRSALEGSHRGARDFDTAFGVLRRLTERMPEDRHLIHGDLLYHNVLVQGDEISAVLDWGNSMYGDALYDVAWLLYCQPRYTTWPKFGLRGDLQRHWEESGAIPDDLEARLLCYQIHVGLDAQLYAAFKGDRDELDKNTEQTMKLVGMVQ